jgi:ABC-type nitrate/sulfonate/bicarbonate transport system substrate-binding protein
MDRRDFLALVGATALVSNLPRSVSAQSTPGSLTLGFQNTLWGTIAMIADAQKTFKKAGVNVNPFKFEDGKSTRDAMVANRIDIGVLGATPFVIGAAKGDMLAIGVAMYGGKTDSVVAGKKTGIKSIAELKGRKVASQLGSATDHVFQNKILSKNGLSKSDIRVINIPFQNHIAALVAGSVDAFAGVEPFPSVAEVDGLGVVLADYSKYDILPVILAANRPVVERKRDAVVAFLRGWLDAVKVFTDNREAAAQIVSNFFKSEGFDISDKVLRLMLSKLDLTPYYVPTLQAYLEEESKQLMEQRQIASIPDWSKLLNRELLQQAMKG